MKGMINLFLTGVVVLLVAIFANLLAANFGLATWHLFLQEISSFGVLSALQNLSFFSALFLFIVYPAVLGLSLVLAQTLFKPKTKS